MPKRPRPSKRLPVKYPSVPDYESGPTRYNEPTTAVAADRVPGSTFEFDLSIAISASRSNSYCFADAQSQRNRGQAWATLPELSWCRCWMMKRFVHAKRFSID